MSHFGDLKKKKKGRSRRKESSPSRSMGSMPISSVLHSLCFRSCLGFLPWLLWVGEHGVEVESLFLSEVALDCGLYYRTGKQNKTLAWGWVWQGSEGLLLSVSWWWSPTLSIQEWPRVRLLFSRSKRNRKTKNIIKQPFLIKEGRRIRWRTMPQL